MSTPLSFAAMVPGTLIPAGTTSTTTQTAVEAITKVVAAIKPQTPSMDLQVVGIDRSVSNLYFSACALIDTRSRNGYVFLLAGSNTELPPSTENIPGGMISVPQTPADSIDSAFYVGINQILGSMFSKGEPLTLNYLVIPSVLQVTEETMYTYVAQAATMIYRLTTPVEDLNLERYSTNSVLQISATSAVRSDTGPDGLPTFTTHRVVVSGGQRSAGQKSINHIASRPLVQIDAFVDGAWAPGNQGGVQGAPMAHYIPRMIMRITNHTGNSVPGTLLGVAAATCLGKDNAWANQYLTRHPLLNVGSLMADTLVAGQAMDTAQAAFTPGDMNKLVNTLFHKNAMLYSLAIGRYSVLSLNQEVFVSASRGSQAANEEIIAAADTLTGGHFRQIWRGGQCVLINGTADGGNDDVRLVGTWMGTDQTRHSTGEIDHTVGFMCRVGDQSQDALTTFLETKTPGAGSPRARLARNRALLSQLTGGMQIQSHDIERLVTFTGPFMAALTEAVTRCSINLDVNVTNSLLSEQPRVPMNNSVDLGLISFGGGLSRRQAQLTGGPSW